MSAKTPVVNLSVFQELLEDVTKGAHKTFAEDKEHRHIFIVISKEGSIEAIDFDNMMSVAMPLIQDEGRAKEVIYKTLARSIRTAKAVGFIDVFEAWGIAMPMEDGESKKTGMERWGKIMDQYKEIRDIPTRVESLMISARFKNTHVLRSWTIGRREKEVFLHNYREIKETDQDSDMHGGRQGELHEAVVAVIKGED